MSGGIMSVTTAIRSIGTAASKAAAEVSEAVDEIKKTRASSTRDGNGGGGSTPSSSGSVSAAGVTPTGLGRALQSTAGRP